MTSQTATSYFYLEGEASAVPADRAGSESITVEFQGWLGDDLLDLVDRWIVSGRLADALRSSELTGYELAPVTVTKNDQWALMQHEFELPERWERLIPTGKRRDGDDFARERRSGLMVSARTLDLVRSFRLNQAEVNEVTTPIWATDEEEDAAEEARLARLRGIGQGVWASPSDPGSEPAATSSTTWTKPCCTSACSPPGWTGSW